MGHVHASSGPEILRVRGLVIEDAEGRPRALLGAPFPRVLGRKRQDEGSNALVFLNEEGSDRLIVGEGIDPQIEGKVYAKEKRAVVGSDYGVSITDGSGNERGGFGFTAIPAGGGRAVIATGTAEKEIEPAADLLSAEVAPARNSAYSECP